MGSSNKTTTQSTSNEPWGPSGDALEKILKKANRLHKNDSGFNAYPGEGYVPFSDETNQALGQMTNLANQGNQFSAGANSFTKGLIGGDYNLDQSGLRSILGNNPNAINTYGKGIASGAEGIGTSGFQSMLGQGPNAFANYASGIASGDQKVNVNPQLQALLGQNANAINQYGTGIASGANGIGTEGDYRSLLGSVDPDFEKVVSNTANDVTDSLNRSFGGANFGSAGHSDYLTKQVGDVVSKMRSDNFNQNLASKAGILGSISGIQGQNIGNQLGAMSALSGEQSGNRAQQAGILGQMGGFDANNLDRILSATSGLSGEQQQGILNNLSALGSIAGIQGQNINNRLGAASALSGEQQQGFNNSRGIYGDLANLSQQDIQNRLSGLGMMDQVYASQYLPSQMLAGVGAAKEAKAGEKLQADMDKFAIEDMSEWDRLMNYFGIASGTGAQGGTTTQSVQTPSNPWSSILGGGLLASQAFS